MPSSAVALPDPPPPADPEGPTLRPVLTPEEFRRVYELHLALTWRTLRRFGVPEGALDDAVQDVFSIVHTRWSSFEGRSAVKTWIFGIARRVARKHRPDQRQEPDTLGVEGTPAGDIDSSTTRIEQRDRVRLLYQLLDELAPERRDAFCLVEIEQFTVQEAAEALEVNVHTLSSRLRAARKDLSQKLARWQARDDWRNHAGS